MNNVFLIYYFQEEPKFIHDHVVMIGQYLGLIQKNTIPNKFTNLEEIITRLWTNFLKNLREIRVIWEEEEKEKLQTEEKKNKELRNLEAEVQRAKANVQARMLESNLGGPEEEEYETFNKNNPSAYLLLSNNENAGPAKNNNSKPPPSMLQAVRRKGRNFNPNQQPHNSQNPQPPISNLEKKLAAFAASLNN
jgi:hypothetical protein